MAISGETAVRLQAALCSTAAAQEVVDAINAGAGAAPDPTIPIPVLTATTGTLPTPDGSTTIADAGNPNPGELLDAVVELQATVAALVNTLKNHDLIASS